jgi:hypothetical protein
MYTKIRFYYLHSHSIATFIRSTNSELVLISSSKLRFFNHTLLLPRQWFEDADPVIVAACDRALNFLKSKGAEVG